MGQHGFEALTAQFPSAAEVAAAINAAEARIREAVPIARAIYLEPDIYDEAAAARGTNPAMTPSPDESPR